MATLYKKTVYVKDPKTGKKVKSLSKNWYARYTDADGIDRRASLSSDKNVAQKMLAELVKKTERGITVDTFAEAVKMPVDEHVDEFEQHLIAKNNTAEHVRQTIFQVNAYLDHAKPRTITQINLASVEKFLSEMRKKRNTSLSTCNHYIRAIKSFCNWLVKNDRLVRHPLLALSLFNADTDPRHARRPLTRSAAHFCYEFGPSQCFAENGPNAGEALGHQADDVHLYARCPGGAGPSDQVVAGLRAGQEP